MGRPVHAKLDTVLCEADVPLNLTVPRSAFSRRNEGAGP